ncbi:MAG: cytochrome c oxidase assembly protein [Gammaproteobacteria bacterium]|nr:cytochrome c oxidase assembly protein [Gammaproteobacteria bacterium]
MNTTDTSARSGTNHHWLVGRLALVVVAMFGFGYALVPLYQVFCELTGINGKTGMITASEAASGKVDSSRWVTVEFTGDAMQGLPWEFRPNTSSMRVHPGDIVEATFHARNNSKQRMVAQAVPSVAPSRAAAHFKKTECFCFTQQTLEPGEAIDLPVRFVVQSDLPTDVNTITLSYAFFGADNYADKIAESGSRSDDVGT